MTTRAVYMASAEMNDKELAYFLSRFKYSCSSKDNKINLTITEQVRWSINIIFSNKFKMDVFQQDLGFGPLKGLERLFEFPEPVHLSLVSG